MVNKIYRFIRSPKFFTWIVALFLIQGTLFALIVDPSNPDTFGDNYPSRDAGVPPDGNRHIAAIYLFAEQPLSEGPFIHDQDPHQLWIGDLERFPSYFYYYFLSFFVRVSMALGASDMVNVMVIRFVGLAIGLLALFVFRKIVRELKIGEAIVNLSSFALVLTGSFAWLSPVENYDIMALTGFFLFMLAAIRFVVRRDPLQLYPMALWFFVTSITKYTYVPFMGLIGLLAVFFFVRKYKKLGAAWRDSLRRFGMWIKAKRIVSVLLLVLLVTFGGLFTERIVGNLVTYHSFDPNCSLIHEHNACMAFGVYSRNYNREQSVKNGERDDFTYHPGYTLYWIHRYYTSMYTYLAHVGFKPNWMLMYPGFIAALGVTGYAYVYARRRRERILQTPEQKLLGATVVLLIVSQYLFNTNIYLDTHGATYAHQGRYLLSAVGFVYVLMLLTIQRALTHMSVAKRQKMKKILLAVGALVIATNSALVMFFVHADSVRWYNVELLPFINNFF